MIIFVGSGRLGNQIFQLHFLESIRKPGERVCTLGMGQVIKYMTGFEPLHNTESAAFYWIFDRIIKRILTVLAKIHIISTAIEMHNVGYHKVTKGILPVTLSLGYFQNDEYIKNCPNKNLKFKEEYFEKAKSEMDKFNNFKKVFIHVRHGDYSSDMQLPDEYYKQAFEKLKATKSFNPSKTALIFLGDDPEWCKKTFTGFKNTYFSSNDLMTDFGIMMMCDGAIISNSTFAWLGAYYCKNTLPVFAPKYWTNWKEKQWYPLQIKTEKFQFFDWREE